MLHPNGCLGVLLLLRLQLGEAASAELQLHTHTGLAVKANSCWMDEAGLAYLHTERGLGLVHTLDTGVLADAIEAGQLPEPQAITQAELPAKFGFVLSLQALVKA